MEAHSLTTGLMIDKQSSDVYGAVSFSTPVAVSFHARTFNKPTIYHVVEPAGGIGSGPFTWGYLVDDLWATVVAAGGGTEGQTFTTFHGHTFDVFSTVGAAIADGIAAFSRAFSVFVVGHGSGAYSEKLNIAAFAHEIHIYGSGIDDTVIGGNVLSHIIAAGNSIYFYNLTLTASVAQNVFADNGGNAFAVYCDHVNFLRSMGGNQSGSVYRQCHFALGWLAQSGENPATITLQDCTSSDPMEFQTNSVLMEQWIVRNHINLTSDATWNIHRLVNSHLDVSGAASVAEMEVFNINAAINASTLTGQWKAPPNAGSVITIDLDSGFQSSGVQIRGTLTKATTTLSSASRFIKMDNVGGGQCEGWHIDIACAPDGVPGDYIEDISAVSVELDDARGCKFTLVPHDIVQVKINAGSDNVVDSGIIAAGSTGTIGTAPSDAQYLVLAANGNLSDERVFTPGTALSAVDSGAGNAYTLNHAQVNTGDLHQDYPLKSILTAKGSIYAASAASTPAELAVGANDTLLIADSGEATGLKWIGRSGTAELADVAATEAAGSDDTVPRGDHVHALGIGTTRGDVLVWNSTPVASRLPIGAADRYLKSDGTDVAWGQVGHDELTLIGSTTHARIDSHLDAYNGTIIQPITFVVTSNGTTITGTLDKNPSGDMTQRFSDGYSTLSSGATVTLTAGTATAPNKRFVYILQSDKTTVVEADVWPAAEHIQIAEVVVQTAALVQSDGVLANRNWNNMAKGTDGQGHHTHAWERLRWEHSAYRSGAAVTWSGSGTGALDLAITAAKIYQLHLQDVSAFDTTDPAEVLVPNHPTAAYTATADIETLVLDSAGGSLSNRYYNLVIWGSVSSGSEMERVFINLPGGSYLSEAGATGDTSGFDNLIIPEDFRGYAYLIQRVTIKHSPAAGGTWTIDNANIVNLRGVVPGITAGGGTSVNQVEFADSQFRVFDDGDPTKVLAFQVSGVSASTTRTLTVPDADGIIALRHDLLDGLVHTDSVAQGVTAGSIIYANDTPKWDELVISVPNAGARNVLAIDNGETVPSWKGLDSLFDADGDTGIQVEESADEDLLRFDAGGNEVLIISSSGSWQLHNEGGVASWVTLAFEKATSGGAVVNNQPIGVIRADPHDGSDFDSGAQIAFFADEAHTATNHGQRIEFYTVPDGSTTVTLALTLEQDQTATFAGDISLGGATTGITGTELETLSDGSDADALHIHSLTPQAHKDSHDPNDGSDALDTANAAEISVVVAAGTGTSHSFARADHIHAINHAITDNHIVTVDGTANANEYARFTAAGLEGRTEAEFKADFNLQIGTDVLAEQTIGIADDNLLEVDDADAADNDYAKFTAAGLEGRSFAEVLADLSGQAGATFSFNDQSISNVGDIALDSLTADDGTTIIANDLIEFQDNIAAVFGTDADASILHDNSNLVINVGTGDLTITGGDLDVAEHAAIGTDATPSASQLLILDETTTAATGTANAGLTINYDVNAASNAVARYHAVRATAIQAGSGNITDSQALRGFFGGTDVTGTGTIKRNVGVQAVTNVTAAITTGNIEDMIGVESQAFIGTGATLTADRRIAINGRTFTGSGTKNVGTNTILNLETPADGTTNWSMTAAGGDSYHAGNLRLGDTSPPSGNGPLDLALPTHDLEFEDASSTSTVSGTPAGYVKLQINSVVRYLRCWPSQP